jgi:hypothetical protein
MAPPRKKSAKPARRPAVARPRADRRIADRPVPDRPIPDRPVAEAKEPIDTAVDRFFTNDAAMRTALKRNLQERGAEAVEVAVRAKAAFAQFTPSKYSEAERSGRRFVAADDTLARLSREVLDQGIERMRTAPARGIKVDLNGALAGKIDRGGDGAGRIALGDLMDYIAQRTGGPLEASHEVALKACRAEHEAERRLKDVLGELDEDDGDETDPDKPPVPNAPEADAQALVAAQVHTQMTTATSPEERLRYAVPSRGKTSDTDQAIETFELRAGPADVTSYHDFNHLQIAFEHVWAEIFDGRLGPLGQELYHEYVKLQEFVGVPADERRIDTIDDLKRLMDDVRELGKLTNDATPGALKPPDQANGGGGSTSPTNTADAVVDVVRTVLDPASVVTDAIGDETVAAILNPGGALIDAIADALRGVPQIRYAAFPGPLPGNGDLIAATIEENVIEAGAVEIFLTTATSTRGWKGLKVTTFDANNKPVDTWWIANDPNDRGVWRQDSFNRLPIWTGEAARALVEFWHEGMFGIHTACYVLTNIGEVLTDRRRITFYWIKD